MIRRLLPTTVALLTLATPALAQTTLDTTAPTEVANTPSDADHPDDRVRGLIAIGGGFVPKYEGASNYKATPYPLAAVRWRGMEWNITGTQLKVDLGGGSHFLFGPVIAMSDSRDRKDTKGAMSLLDPIGDSVSYGAFAGYRFGGDEKGQGRMVVSVQGTKDSKSEKGMTFNLGMSYAALRQKRLFMTLDASAQFTTAKYNRTFFGVTEAESEVSGLDAYRPDGGLSKIKAGVTAGYQLSRHWGVIARIEGGTYTGAVADSPIIDEGSKKTGKALLGISYAF